MTNGDYLRGLNNEKLAEFIWSKKICDSHELCNDPCSKCIKQWLETEINPDVEIGQIRREKCRNRSWLILDANEKSNWCMAVDKDGNVEKLAVGIVRTWDVEEENVNVIQFLERLFQIYKNI